MTLRLNEIWGNIVSLTDKRKAHILEHPEMHGQENAISQTLFEPDVVVQSQSDETVKLFHRLYKGLFIGDKYLCVVVKYIESNNFIITAYFTDKVKKGKILWKK